MGKGKENKRKRVRTGYIKVECLLMEKKGVHSSCLFLLVFYFSFALDLRLINFLLFFTFVGFFILR